MRTPLFYKGQKLLYIFVFIVMKDKTLQGIANRNGLSYDELIDKQLRLMGIKKDNHRWLSLLHWIGWSPSEPTLYKDNALF